MKKLIITFGLVFLLTGCSSSANIIIDKEGKVTENVNFVESNSVLSEFELTQDQYMENYRKNYDDIFNFYEYKDISDNQNMATTLKKEFGDICKTFNNSMLIKAFFNEVSCSETDETYEINATSNYFSCDEDCLEPPALDSLSLTINSKLKVLDNNANEIEGQKYTWNFDESSDNNFKLVIKKDNKTVIKQKANKVINNKYIVILCIGILILIFAFSLYKKYKKNKLEY